MMIVIYTGEAALANELLPNTKVSLLAGNLIFEGWTVASSACKRAVPYAAFPVASCCYSHATTGSGVC